MGRAAGRPPVATARRRRGSGAGLDRLQSQAAAAAPQQTRNAVSAAPARNPRAISPVQSKRCGVARRAAPAGEVWIGSSGNSGSETSAAVEWGRTARAANWPPPSADSAGKAMLVSGQRTKRAIRGQTGKAQIRPKAASSTVTIQASISRWAGWRIQCRGQRDQQQERGQEIEIGQPADQPGRGKDAPVVHGPLLLVALWLGLGLGGGNHFFQAVDFLVVESPRLECVDEVFVHGAVEDPLEEAAGQLAIGGLASTLAE